MKQKITYALSLCLIISTLTSSLFAQTAWERSVLLSATLQTSPNSIELNWPPDATAQGYEVYRKGLEEMDWGQSRASLAGFANSYLDETVEPGEIYEYAVFKQNFESVSWELCIPAGEEVQLVFNDMYGIGLCCNFGFGYYSATVCDEQLAYGDNFGRTDTTYFEICDRGDSCELLTIEVFPDMFPNSTSWNLSLVSTGEILGTSGPVNTFIAPRPRYGFISTAIDLPPTDYRGTLLLLVEQSLWDTLSPEIEQLEMDLIRDHWRVKKMPIDPTESVMAVRSKIQAQYQALPDLEALYLLGHIPVPYSGDIYPDTHSENHQGAWSADPYYAELNGTWTDEVANIQTAFFPRNHNIPGDGKWDQDSIPSPVELQMGRVDLSRMPSFGESEIELTRRYLQKAHAFKNGQIEVERRALIDDNFGQAFAAPAASGWRNFAPMFGANEISTSDYFESMRQGSYLWSYGCGSGSHLSAAGIGNTSDFAQDSLLSVFTMLFGSQFGDWDNTDNFLRAPLASGLTLTNCWAGNPPWTFHHMALGFPIGYAARRSMNSNNGVYLTGPQLVHMALLGDPSLRQYIVDPLPMGSLFLRTNSDRVELTWPTSTEAEVAGYLVYRADSISGIFTRLSDQILTDTFWIDTDPIIGTNYYQVKVVLLEESASGTFYNQSLGLLDSIEYSPVVGVKELAAAANFQLFPNPTAGLFEVIWEKEPQASVVRIYSVQGQLLVQESIENGPQPFTIDLASYGPGLYWVQIGSQVQPLILSD